MGQKLAWMCGAESQIVRTDDDDGKQEQQKKRDSQQNTNNEQEHNEGQRRRRAGITAETAATPFVRDIDIDGIGNNDSHENNDD